MLYQGSGRVFKVLSKIVVHAAREGYTGAWIMQRRRGGKVLVSDRALRKTPGRTEPTRLDYSVEEAR